MADVHGILIGQIVSRAAPPTVLHVAGEVDLRVVPLDLASRGCNLVHGSLSTAPRILRQSEGVLDAVIRRAAADPSGYEKNYEYARIADAEVSESLTFEHSRGLGTLLEDREVMMNRHLASWKRRASFGP